MTCLRSLIARLARTQTISFLLTSDKKRPMAVVDYRQENGATRADVLKLIGIRGAKMIAIGAAAGLTASLLIARLMAGLLYGISPTDPATLIAAVLFLAAIALTATWLPARSAARIDPLVALRYE